MSARHSHGYVLIFVGKKHHLAQKNGYAYEHRVLAERMLGRRLARGEVVHHVDGNTANNAPSNLRVYPSNAHHLVEHRRSGTKRLRLPGQSVELRQCACGCGDVFEQFDSLGRERVFVSGHNRRKAGDRSNDAILSAFDGGESGRSIATRLGVSINAVHCALRAARKRAPEACDPRGVR